MKLTQAWTSLNCFFHSCWNTVPNLATWPQSTYSNSLVEQTINMDFGTGGVLCVCIHEQQDTHGTFTCYVKPSLEGLGNYSRLRGFILGVCCVIVSPSYLPCSTWWALCGCTGSETSLLLKVHWMISWEQYGTDQAASVKVIWQPVSHSCYL